MRLIYGMSFAVAALLFVGVTGCGSSNEAPATEEPVAEVSMGDHSGWWCVEHGVPEEECPLCDTSLVGDFKEKGDWCDEHNRPDSQCFTCNPDNFTQFAARYEAKFGEQPPQPTE
ncbi:hypothetical protein LF1_06210 [Rubripirellula obstinata]|uniref:RND transporter n=1 Tax=Rubripirellula obstinata TaxID=406547 RepID=A0A5B1CC19_9BACT|nr:RND transporter [Rubripirellula obstinata]KAA1258106.1 hypothetical protein LF1_06210 [Rubripirellula obstinata]